MTRAVDRTPWRTEGRRLLRVFLGQAGLSQKALALDLDVDEAELSRFLNGVRRPDIDLAARIETVTRGIVGMRAWTERPRDDDGCQVGKSERCTAAPADAIVEGQ